MKQLKLLVTLLFTLVMISFSVKAQNIAANAEALLSAYYKQDLFTGTVIIAQKGKVVFEKSYGMANRENATLNTSNTQYKIGSISKPITSLMILQLQQQGLLKLSNPLNEYFDGFAKGDSITIENLLNHTSGIKSISATKVYNTSRSSIKTKEDVLNIIKAEPLLFQPGSKYQYSNSNYILLSYIAEKVTGKSFSELVNVFASKLGMKNTGLDYDNRVSSAKAIGYEAGAVKDFIPVSDNNLFILAGAGGIYSTAKDLLLLDKALYNEDVLSNDLRQQAFKAGKGNYGLGWEIGEYKGQIEISHSGSIEGFKSMILRYPENETCIIFLSNYWNTMGPEICEGLKAIAFNKSFELPQAKSYVSLNEDQLKKYEGQYQFNAALSMTLKTESGILLSEIKGQPVVGFKAISETEFYNKSNDAVIVFSKDENGNFASFKLKKGKQVMEWKRS